VKVKYLEEQVKEFVMEINIIILVNHQNNMVIIFNYFEVITSIEGLEVYKAIVKRLVITL
jgi:hypothetical protein